MEEPEEKMVFTAEERGILVACAIIGLFLFVFRIGYGIGKDFAQ